MPSAALLRVASSLSATVNEVQWEQFSQAIERPNINIYNKRYELATDGINWSKAYGLVANESPYDFRSITIRVILRDRNNKVLGFNSTEQRTMKSHEERDFTLPWPKAFPGTVEKVDMEIDADVYHSENFIQQYFPGGQF